MIVFLNRNEWDSKHSLKVIYNTFKQNILTLSRKCVNFSHVSLCSLLCDEFYNIHFFCPLNMIYFDRNNFPADGNISELCETVHSNLKSCLTVIYKVPCDPVSQLSPLSRDSFISFSLLKQIRALETCWWILLSCCGCAEADISVLRPELQCFISDYQLTRDAALSAARLWHPSCSIVVKTVRFPSLISIISSQQQHLNKQSTYFIHILKIN